MAPQRPNVNQEKLFGREFVLFFTKLDTTSYLRADPKVNETGIINSDFAACSGSPTGSPGTLLKWPPIPWELSSPLSKTNREKDIQQTPQTEA